MKMTSRYGLAALTLLGAMSAAQAADIFKGETLYQEHCQQCHGPRGEGAMPGTPNFARGEALIQTDRQLAETVRRGRGIMPAYGGLLRDDEIDDLVAFLRTFQ